MSVISRLVHYTGPGLVLQELLYGFIMALLFVTAAQAGIATFPTNDDLIVAIISMNTAWGLVDMIVFTLVDRFDQKKYLRIVNAKDEDIDEKIVNELIHNNLSGTIVDVLDEEDEKRIVRAILTSKQESEAELKQERKEIFKTNFICFLLTVSTCIPVIIPLLIFPDSMMHQACLWSAAISTGFLFLVGYFMHSYTGINRWVMGFMVSGIAVVITFMALLLGG